MNFRAAIHTLAGLLAAASALSLSTACHAAAERDEVIAATMVPFTGKALRGVDPSTLDGKVVCGYQGWFNCEGDGARRGWVHWVKGGGAPSPGNVKVDLWPDVSEFAPEELFDTSFRQTDGKAARVFSSYTKATVLRHFRWMREYGIDGALVQRFVAGSESASFHLHNNSVLAHCREGANAEGRTYAVMYDLSGLGAGRIEQVMEDWRLLRTRMKIGDDPAYLHHRGKPLVAVWGIGFSDKRAYTLEECARLVDFLKNDPEAGGCTVMLGVPAYWREGNRDAVPDPLLKEIIAKADVVSPWTVGRYGTASEVTRHTQGVAGPDMAWCAERKLDYLPVCFPGFSWHNMYGAPLASIPRQKGDFFWSQFHAYAEGGARMLYVAMFDEVDEGTAIFKCTNEPPATPETPFVTFEGLPSDYYLRLAGEGARMLRGEIAPDAPKP